MTEQWKPVPGASNYEVSTRGRIRSYAWGKPKMMKPTISRYAYVYITDDEGNRRNRTVHRIMAEAFMPNGSGIVRHLNDDPIDNRLDNLAWGDQLDNMADAIGNGWHSNRGRRNGQAKLTPDDVRAIRSDPRSPDRIAADYPVCAGHVRTIKARKAWTHIE